MGTKIFKGEHLRRLVYDDVDETEGRVVETELVDTRRWSTVYSMIFEFEGKFYETSYSVGSTEQQDERPFEYEDEVECTEVHQVTKTVLVWKAV